MRYNAIVISSGHGKFVAGASGILGDEVTEARKVTDRVAAELADRGVGVKVFHDNTSHDQNTNLETIVAYHNAHIRDLDVSIHFNAYVETTSARAERRCLMSRKPSSPPTCRPRSPPVALSIAGQKRTTAGFIFSTIPKCRRF